MPEDGQSILPLPPEVAAQIKSSNSIPSLTSATIGLICNSMDASACKIDISVDFGRGTVSVEDDGEGIPPKEFEDTGGLGKLHYTSKNNDLEATHGQSGSFLASMAAISILTITSHHHAHMQHASLILHHSRPAARLIPAPPHQHLSNREHGTRVVVQDLFGNTAVRVKQRALVSANGGDDKQFESLKKQVIGLLLAWNAPVSLKLKSLEMNKRINIHNGVETNPKSRQRGNLSRPLELPRICNILAQAGYIEPSDWGDWIKTSARTHSITIKGAISLQPAPSKLVQFMSLDMRPIYPERGSNALFDEVNRLFAASSFGSREEVSFDEDANEAGKQKDRRFKQDGFTNKQLKGGGKGVDRWPMFYIRIELHSASRVFHNDVERLEDLALDKLLRTLGAMITGFLEANHFRPRARPRNRRAPDLDSPNHRAKASTSSDECALNLPPTQTNGDAFSLWSRLKSGNRVKSSGPAQSPIILRDSHMSKEIEPNSNEASDTLATKAMPVTTSQRPDPTSVVDNCDNTDDPSLKDQTVEWVDPISGSLVLINARTGLVVYPQAPKRPQTAPSSHGRFSLPSISAAIAKVPRSDGQSLHTTSSPIPTTKADSWSHNLLKKWTNPIFETTEQAIPQVSFTAPSLDTAELMHGRRHCCTDSDIQKALTQSSLSVPATLSRDALRSARIVAQVDQKFVLIRMSAAPQTQEQILVLVDQHAADERVRVEGLLADLSLPPATLAKPLIFEIHAREQRLLSQNIPYFASWGIVYQIITPADAPKCELAVSALPAPVAERCRIEPRVLIEMLRGEAWKRKDSPPKSDPSKAKIVTSESDKAQDSDKSWLSRLATCPKSLLDLLNSRACRSAIMFNDVLLNSECETLIQRLAQCAFPFQCAHGRPSMVPLVSLGGTSGDDEGNGIVVDGEVGTTAFAMGECLGHGEGRGYGHLWQEWRSTTDTLDE